MRMRPSVVLETGARTIVPSLLLLSIFLLVAGHNAPGGGFVGGLIAGAALVIAFLARGPQGVGELLPAAPASLLGAGLALALAAGLTGLVAGDAFLDALQATIRAPLLGTIKLNTALAFDLGVYLVVLGMAAAVLQSLGAGEEP